MQKKCSKCGKSIKEVGKLLKVTWLGDRRPLCKKCRENLRKQEKKVPIISSLLKRFGR